MYKIAGALAKRGASLDEVYNTAQWVSSHVGTIGVGLEHCHVPGTAAPESHLGPDEIEIGMGIHNEPGHRRLSPIPPLNQLLPQLVEFLTSTTDTERSFLPFKNNGSDRVVLLVNNLGGVSELELANIAGEARKALEAKGVKVERLISGTFMVRSCCLSQDVCLTTRLRQVSTCLVSRSRPFSSLPHPSPVRMLPIAPCSSLYLTSLRTRLDGSGRQTLYLPKSTKSPLERRNRKRWQPCRTL